MYMNSGFCCEGGGCNALALVSVSIGSMTNNVIIVIVEGVVRWEGWSLIVYLASVN